MIQFYFVPSKLPRTWTKTQWKEAYRWVRVTRKELNKQAEKQMADFAAFGTTMPERMREDYMNNMINPPLLLGPGME